MTGRPDVARVRALLGREPQGCYEIVARDRHGDPLVLRNAPLLDDGTPMPTRYWLVGRDESARVARLEAGGGVDAAEAAVDPGELADAHARYAAERDAALPADHAGPRPSGGVGGTRAGVKCLHAHWAWHLAGGDDPVGRWIAARFASAVVDVANDATVIHFGDGSKAGMPWGPTNLTDRWLAEHDPPRPEALTNALGTVDDHLDDVQRSHVPFAELRTIAFRGPPIDSLARLETGSERPPAVVPFDRTTAEEVFRMVATETSDDRRHNPGLPSADVGTIVGTCTIVIAVMRRCDLASVDLCAGDR